MAEPTGSVTFDENLDGIMDATIDEPTVPLSLPYLPTTVPKQRKVRYMRPSRKTSYSHLGNNNKGYYNAVTTTASSKIYATAVCNLKFMALINYEKGFGNATKVLTSYYLAINEMI